MAALYSVFTEITGTLSLQYVVEATLQETHRLMNCETVVLRLLKDGQLEVAGSRHSYGTKVENLSALALGEGPAGRVAQRGRSLRIGENSQDILTNLQRERDIQSGLIIPLIIGARIVGTLNCWSSEPNAFTEDNERVHEMMGSLVATAVVAAEITDSSEHQAHHDPLTGLPNRLQLEKDTTAGLGQYRQYPESQVVVAMIDIDHFKSFNDDFGHQTGDLSLQKVASILQASIREQDHVYRYGGEEFLLILADMVPSSVFEFADQIRPSVESATLASDEFELVRPVKISIGLAYFPSHGSDFADLVSLADHAMYSAKANSGNKVFLWDETSASPFAAA